MDPLSESRLRDICEGCDVAVLPWGATESHNWHLPYGTDTIQAEAIARASARKACDSGARIISLPALPFGANAQQMDIPLTINMNPSTQRVVLQDIVDSLEMANVPFLVVLNGHGGNDFRWMVREMQPDTSVFMVVVDWFRFLDPARWFDEPGDHAGEMETSLMMHIASHLVAPLSEAGPGAARPFRIKALREGRAWAPREWTKVTSDTGVGNPGKANAEKGERFFEALTDELAEFLVELSRSDPNNMYQN